MLKKIIALALALCMLLGPCAVAESALPYRPGERAQELFLSALSAGKIVTGDLTLHLDADPSLFGVSQSERELFSAVLKTLDNAHFTFGFGTPSDCIRLELGAALDAQDGSSSVSIGAAADMTWDGMSIESDLIPGQRVTVEWETLLYLMDVDAEYIELYNQIHALGPERVLEVVAEEFDELVNAFFTGVGDALAPYAAIIGAHVSALNMQTQFDVPAQGDYPAAATQITAYVSAKDLASLLSDLVDQTERDGYSNAQEIKELRDSLAYMATADGGIIVTVGLDESGLPLFVMATVDRPGDGGVYMFSLIATPDASGNAYDLKVSAFHSDTAGSVDSFTLNLGIAVDPSDPVLEAGVDVDATANVISGGASVYNLDYHVATHGATSADGLPAAETTVTQTQVITDSSETVRMISSVEGVNALTADGGEGGTANGSLDMYIDNLAVQMQVQSAVAYAPDGQGGVSGGITTSVSMPALGVNAYDIGVALASKDYDPSARAALTAIALETVTNEQLQALEQTLTVNAMQKAFAALSILPEPLMSLIMQDAM